jgi:hypothetical protein
MALCSEPVVAYPRKKLTIFTSGGYAKDNETNNGGLGAILCQTDQKSKQQSNHICKQTIPKT